MAPEGSKSSDQPGASDSDGLHQENPPDWRIAVAPESLEARWEVVGHPTAGEGLSRVGDIVSLCPAFHVGDRNSDLRLAARVPEGFKLVRPEREHGLLFHGTHQENPISCSFTDGDQRVELSWTGGEWLTDTRWERWIFKLEVVAIDAQQDLRGRVYLAFSYMSTGDEKRVSESLTLGGPYGAPETSLVQGSRVVGACPEDSPRLSVRIDILESKEPRFPDLFDEEFIKSAKLPKGVYVEPLIVFKKSEAHLIMEFTSDDGIFFPAEPGLCNRTMDSNGKALALVWRGVTDPDLEEDCDPPVARGFCGSFCEETDPESPRPNCARILWREPTKDQTERLPRVASFFFKNLAAKGGAPGEEVSTLNLESNEGLIDPVVVYDLESPG